jgi:hypothetical protein
MFIDDQRLRRLSPLGWDHINLTGDYVWSETATYDVDGPRLSTANRSRWQHRNNSHRSCYVQDPGYLCPNNALTPGSLLPTGAAHAQTSGSTNNDRSHAGPVPDYVPDKGRVVARVCTLCHLCQAITFALAAVLGAPGEHPLRDRCFVLTAVSFLEMQSATATKSFRSGETPTLIAAIFPKRIEMSSTGPVAARAGAISSVARKANCAVLSQLNSLDR